MKDINSENKLNENIQEYFNKFLLELKNKRLIEEFILFLIQNNPEHFVEKFLFNLPSDFRYFIEKKGGIEVFNDEFIPDS